MKPKLCLLLLISVKFAHTRLD
ncbi:hypothetical protein MPC1_80012 [Methylocella tundrae]|nr:hypothetical protein MPC1_80012 [Methylocella tundrae]